jgi:hypothetical protein
MTEKYQSLLDYAISTGATLTKQDPAKYTADIEIHRTDSDVVMTLKGVAEFKIVASQFDDVADFKPGDTIKLRYVNGHLIMRTDSKASSASTQASPQKNSTETKAPRGSGSSKNIKAF